MDKNVLNQVLDRTIGWINNCDTKTSIILSGLCALSVVLLATDHISKSISIMRFMFDNISSLNVIYLIFIIMSIVLVLIGIFFLIMVLLSRTNILKYEKNNVSPESLLFFGTISGFSSVNGYKDKIEKYDEKQYINDLINQIYVCSIICNSKFKYYKKGLICSIVGVVLYCLMDFVGFLIVCY